MRLWKLCGLAALFLTSCSHIPLRMPQSVTLNYNPEKVQLLRMAAAGGVLFMLSDSALHDVPLQAAGDQCRRAQEGDWIERVYSTLKIFRAQPELITKIHTIEFRRGDKPAAEISHDLDGAATLVLSYAKVETREKIVNLSDVPCADGGMDYLGKDLVTTRFEWPDQQAVTNALLPLPERAKVERLEFDRRFVAWLAERQTIVRLSPELAFEKTTDGKSLLSESMDRLSNEITANPKQQILDFWLNEISSRSAIGASLKFFSIKRDQSPSTGILVDVATKFQHKINGMSEPTYIYLSYKVENGAFKISTLGDLDRCLLDFTATYRSPVTSMNSYDLSPENFLAPGHYCQDGISE